MKELVPVEDIMTKNVVKLNITDHLSKAEKLFKSNNIRHIPVMKSKEIVGILSYSDLLKVSVADSGNNEDCVESTVYNSFSLEQVMTKNVVTMYPFTPIKQVAEILSTHDFRALPILCENELIGMVTTTDLMKYMVSQFGY